MTRKTTVCSDVKRTFFPETTSYGDGWYEKILIGTATYKGYKFRATHRTYKESNGYDEYENLLQCTTTDEVVAEDSINFNQCIVDYVKGLKKQEHTKDIIISMLLRSDLIYRWKHGKFFEYHGRYDKCNRKQKLQFLKKELNKLSLTELYKLMKLCNCSRVMKMCSGDRYTDEGLHYYQCFWLNENNEVIGEFIDINEEYCRDVECDKHSTFYLLTHYNGMDF